VYLTDLATICRSAGLDVVEVRGWRTRGHGPMTAVRTIVCHHTAGPATGNMPSLDVITLGRPGLAGPLANLGLGRDGTVYVVAAGKAYHAGQVRSDSYANDMSIGIEGEGTGVDPWPAVQLEAYATLCAALVRAYRLTPARVLGHKEVCAPVGRKADPNFGMGSFRSRVTSILNSPQEAPLATADEIYAAVWNIDRMRGGWMTPDNPSWAPQTVLLNHYALGLRTLDAIKSDTTESTAAKNNAAGARTEAVAAKVEAAAAKAATTQVQTAVAALSAALATTAADAAATKAAVARIETALNGLTATLTRTVTDAVRQAFADNIVKVDVTIGGNIVAVANRPPGQ
jgi:hypothetical protein